MNLSYDNVIKSLVKAGNFALLAVLTEEDEVILRPIGGDYDAGILEAIEEMNRKYPGCRFRLFEHRYNTYRRYFEGVVPRERLLD